MRVLLPAPFSPTRAWISPPYASKDTVSLATTPGKALVMPRTESRGAVSMIDVSVGSSPLESRGSIAQAAGSHYNRRGHEREHRGGESGSTRPALPRAARVDGGAPGEGRDRARGARAPPRRAPDRVGAHVRADARRRHRCDPPRGLGVQPGGGRGPGRVGRDLLQPLPFARRGRAD